MIIVAATAVAGAAAGFAGAAVYRRGRRARAHELVEERREDRLRRIEDRRSASAEKARVDLEMLRTTLAAELQTLEEALRADAARLEAAEAAAERRAERTAAHEADVGGRFDRYKARREEIEALQARIREAETEAARAVEVAAGQPRDEIVNALADSMGSEAALAARKAAKALEEDALARREDYAAQIMEVACQRYGAPMPTSRLVGQIALPKSKKLAARVLADDRAVLQVISEICEVEFEPKDEETFFVRAAEPYTREVGRLAYERMVRGGNVSEAIARKAAEKAGRDLHKVVRDAGNRAARLLGLSKVHPEILLLVGKLLYRTSYTQNQWQHAIETAHLCSIMADDLGLDIRVARRAALLHDIGKVLWAETEAVGSHAVSGATYARERGEPDEIVHPIAAHHNDEKPSTPYAHLVAAADALSGARPGARRETLEAYKQRVEDLQRISGDYPSIRTSYVIQGGRELRVLVDPARVDDLGAVELSSLLAGRIEEECVYPGQIKVTVVREIRRSAMSR